MSAWLGEATKTYAHGQRGTRVVFSFYRTRRGGIAFATTGAKGLGDLSHDASRLFEEHIR